MKSIATFAAAIAAALLMGTQPAHAVPVMNTYVSPIYQVGNGAGVNLGHTVLATTVYNRLIAGGTFVASCISSVMSPASGQRTLSAETLGGGTSLVVTIPTNQPAIVNMPGFYSLNRGDTVNCTYTWTSRAVESGYSIGFNGISFQTGNGERADGFFKPFTMSVPGDTGTGDFNKCIP
ncbi:MAG TPA: hypothetical protein VMF52_01390 [Steroidobacteraceae bacterium]|nr:hypothetical protein [Steroidobacteraceae bacterium]